MDTTNLPVNASAASLINGHTPAPAPSPAPDWRAAALNASLNVTARRGGKAEEILLRAVREHLPGWSTVSVYPERLHLLQFLHEHCQNVRPLVDGESLYQCTHPRERFWPYLGWYAAEWEGQPVEVALAPDYSLDGEHLLIGRDPDHLRRFADALLQVTDGPMGRCLRYAEGWESAPELDAEVGRVTWDDLVLPDATLKGLRDAVSGWANGRETYAALGFAWRRGVLLVGPPGTGKTMVCKAVAAALPAGMPVLYVRDLREDDRKEAIQAIFKRARRLAPCLLILEDLDSLIVAENRTVFLNELDGFASNEGLLVVASTNHPHKIDEALLKRPSRFDRVFHIGLPKAEERAEFCRRTLTRSTLAGHLSPELDVDDLAQRVAAKTDSFTPAYLKEALVAAALTRAQDAGATVLDAAYADAVLAQVEELRQTLKRLKDPAVLAEMTAGEGTIGLRR
jgi:hypothetical protein